MNALSVCQQESLRSHLRCVLLPFFSLRFSFSLLVCVYILREGRVFQIHARTAICCCPCMWMRCGRVWACCVRVCLSSYVRRWIGICRCGDTSKFLRHQGYCRFFCPDSFPGVIVFFSGVFFSAWSRSLMLALEWQAQLAGGITDRKAYGDMFEGRHLVLNCKSAVMPVFSLATVLKCKDRPTRGEGLESLPTMSSVPRNGASS